MLRPLIGTLAELRRLGAGGDNEKSAPKVCSPRELETRMVCGSMKVATPQEELYVVARQLRLDHIHFGLDHVLDPKRQVRHGYLFLDPIVHAINVLIVVAGQMQDRLPKGLAGDRAGVNANSANHFPPLDERHALAHLGPLDGRALPRRTGTDDNEIVGLHVELI
jgi:hypothetical protein